MITPLACSLVGQSELVRILPGTLAHRLYGAAETVEHFYCNYGVEPEYEPLLRKHGLRVSGFDADKHARIVEIPDHAFFLATLFVPQARSGPGVPHPLVIGFIEAARARAGARHVGPL